MTPAARSDDKDKISSAFAARLAKMKSGEEVRAIVLPVIAPPSEPVQSSTTRTRREKAARATAAAMKSAFGRIDRQLSNTGGRRLTRTPNHLGFIHIEAPAKSLYALAEEEWVSAIMEDQAIRPA